MLVISASKVKKTLKTTRDRPSTVDEKTNDSRGKIMKKNMLINVSEL